MEKFFEYIFSALGFPVWTTFIAIFAVYAYQKWRDFLLSHKKEKSQKINRFLEKFPTILEKNEAILTEQLFLDTFEKPITNTEIQFFLKTKSPTKYIQLFLQANAYFDRSDSPNFCLKEKYSNLKKLCSAKRTRFILYFVFAYTGLISLAYSKLVFSLEPTAWIAFIYLVFSLFLMAYLMLITSTNLDSAISLLTALPELSKENSSQADTSPNNPS